MIAVLHRESDDGTRTQGRLYLDGEPFAFTLEPPWKDNRRNESAVPAGKYLCEWVKSPRFGMVYRLAAVPGRSHVLLHAGNLVRHTHGCVLLGQRRGVFQGEPAVLASGPAVKQLAMAANLQPFELFIVE